MRILILGAGAIGGYFGARLLEAGREVTFLVRGTRATELRSQGLVIKSPRGDITIKHPPTVMADEVLEAFDLVILCCKAYDLRSAIDAIRMTVGPNTTILPLLNGIRHLSDLADAFGAQRILGGQCVIATQLNSQRDIIQFNDQQSLSFGERDGSLSARVKAIAVELDVPNVEARLSETIVLDMWEKWAMLATMAGMTCLMRATLGDILATPKGRDWIAGTFDECRLIAKDEGFPLRPQYVERTLATLLTPHSPLTASMLRDIESNHPVESEHILGDLIRRRRPAESEASVSFLEIAYSHVKSYEARRSRALSS